MSLVRAESEGDSLARARKVIRKKRPVNFVQHLTTKTVTESLARSKASLDACLAGDTAITGELQWRLLVDGRGSVADAALLDDSVLVAPNVIGCLKSSFRSVSFLRPLAGRAVEIAVSLAVANKAGVPSSVFGAPTIHRTDRAPFIAAVIPSKVAGAAVPVLCQMGACGLEVWRSRNGLRDLAVRTTKALPDSLRIVGFSANQSSETLRRWFEHNAAELADCYNDSSFAGVKTAVQIQLSIALEPNGLNEPGVTIARVDWPSLTSCITQVIRSWRQPVPFSQTAVVRIDLRLGEVAPSGEASAPVVIEKARAKDPEVVVAAKANATASRDAAPLHNANVLIREAGITAEIPGEKAVPEIDAFSVKDVVVGRVKGLKSCYQQQLGRGEFVGKLQAVFAVLPNGTVSQVDVKPPAPPEFARCVKSELTGLKFFTSKYPTLLISVEILFVSGRM